MFEISAFSRGVGSKNARALRRQGLLPVIVHSVADPQEKMLLAVSSNSFARIADKKTTTGSMMMLTLEDGKQIKVVVLRIERDIVSNNVSHLELVRADGEQIMSRVPVLFANYAISTPARRGRVLNIRVRAIHMICDTKDYVENITVDLTNASLIQSYRVRDLVLPKSCRLIGCKPNTLVAKFIGSRIKETEDASKTPEVAQAAA